LSHVLTNVAYTPCLLLHVVRFAVQAPTLYYIARALYCTLVVSSDSIGLDESTRGTILGSSGVIITYTVHASSSRLC
jgi:hypothetical protein